MTVLVTGGAGFIGSHTCVELLNAGHHVVVVDNLSNSNKKSLSRIEEITGRQLVFYEVDILDRHSLRKVFEKEQIEAVIHFAGLKAVAESVEQPLRYYHNNVTGTLILCELMREFGVKSIVFSSSATVYGDPEIIPIAEDCPKGEIANPYGHTKSMIEQILMDVYASDNDWSIVLLRYFNPIGAHKSGKIGEDPKGIPNNLMPYISQVAAKKLDYLKVFGDDYETKDGTGVRDYIHVVDLALAHMQALEAAGEKEGVLIYNLGTGSGYSVLEMVNTFEQVNKVAVPYQIAARRPGDIAACYADPTKARIEMGWEAKRGISEMCEDSWRWQSNNPDGFESR